MEKHQTFRLGKAIIFFSAFFAAMVFVFVACRNDLTTTGTIEPNQAAASPAVETAKQWFESNKAVLSTTKYAKLEPRWDKAKDLGNRVELPYFVDSKVNLLTTSQNAKLNQMGRSYLMLLKTNDGYKIHFIDFVPAADFSGDIKTINSDNFKKEKFTGYVILYDEKGAALNSFYYERGENPRKVKITTPNTNLPESQCVRAECVYLIVGHYRDGCLYAISQELLFCTCIEWGTDNDCPGMPFCDNGGGGGGNTTGGQQLCTFIGETWSEGFATLYFGRIDWPNNTYNTLGEMTYSHKINVTNCRTMEYNPVSLSYTTYTTIPGSYDSKNHDFTKLSSEPISNVCSQCGFRASVRCKANAVYTAFAGPWGGFPVPQDLDDVAAFFIKD